MKCFVTGASGFVGANLVHALNHCGYTVRALVRAGSNTCGLAGAEYEAVRGDLSDRAVLAEAIRGCDWCFHVAASYHLWLPDYGTMYAANVEGTRNVLDSATCAGCSRIVYTSTVGCIGVPPLGANRNGVPLDETASASLREMTSHYKRSKWQAERIVLEAAEKGQPVIIVNPSAPVGPRDAKPTPTGKVILDFLNRRMPAYVDTGLNWVHVQDVAMGHILAAERGRVGQRYILGNASGNWTMKEVFVCLQHLTGVPAPRLKVPYSVALLASYVDEFLARLTGRRPKAPLAGVRMARHKMFFSPAKAIRELGLPQTPPEQALADAVEWFRKHGYVQKL